MASIREVKLETNPGNLLAGSFILLPKYEKLQAKSGRAFMQARKMEAKGEKLSAMTRFIGQSRLGLGLTHK
jgi:hypothetical protein